MLNKKSILITGGTGSFGQAFVAEVLRCYPNVERLVIYSRDELKQFEMSQKFSPEQYPAIRYFIGDMRDRDRLRRALEGIDTVIHAAALKQVPAAEYNPFEFINTNVLGAENLVQACLDSDVHKVVALSTDKAAAPINLYGATKLCSDKLFVAANNITGRYRSLSFSVVRYGNVMGSRGSVIPFFINKIREGGDSLPITHTDMTRFNITLREGVKMVMWAMNNGLGEEIFVPKIPSYRVTDVATAIGPNCRQEVVGIRPGEKIHEEMITASDSFTTVDIGEYYAILSASGKQTVASYCEQVGARPIKPGYGYDSGTNERFLTVEEIRKLIREEMDPTFDPV